MPLFNVRVYGVLLDKANRLLVSDEFIRGNYFTKLPGGGLEFGEGTRDCLKRELKEELGIDTWASCLAPLTFASHSYPDFHLLMPLYICRRYEGIPQGREGQVIKWVKAKALRDYPMPPADEPLIPFLKDLL